MLGQLKSGSFLHFAIFCACVDKLKSRLEKHRISRGIQGAADASTTSVQADQREGELIGQLESEKAQLVGPPPDSIQVLPCGRDTLPNSTKQCVPGDKLDEGYS